MFREGIGEGSSFKALHPVTNLIFYAFVLVITMFSNSPVYLACTLVLSWFYSVLLSGVKQIKTNLLFMLPVTIFMIIFNTLFNHNGSTVLFYLNDQRITLESVYYSLAAAVLLSAMIIWFASFNVIMSSDKLIYIFGKAAPVLGLTMSMIFRFIPLLRQRYREISMGQKAMGRQEETKFIPKIRQSVKEVSILISWSLEASIETADSMEARGYGLKGRTSFHLFRLSPADKRMIVLELLTGALAATGLATGRTNVYYYPKFTPDEWDMLGILSLVSYILLMLIQIITDLLGEIKWQQLQQKI